MYKILPIFPHRGGDSNLLAFDYFSYNNKRRYRDEMCIESGFYILFVIFRYQFGINCYRIKQYE